MELRWHPKPGELIAVAVFVAAVGLVAVGALWL